MDTNKFVNRHVGISAEDIPSMLQAIGVKSVDELIDQTIPSDIRLKEPLNLPEPMTEREFAEHISELASKNEVFTSYIGMGWYDTVCPAPIQRNVFENPVWYTSYTPYQAEVSQGRLEALLNFQTVIAELTGLPLANCSLLDEATAAAEAATMFYGSRSRAQMKAEANTLFVDENVFASTLAVINTRMIPQGIKVVVGDYKTFEFTPDVFGAIVQYPNADGLIEDYKEFIVRANAGGARVAVAADLMSLVLLTPPGEWGADVVFGSSQRFGIPMFYGGPSAAFFATKNEYKRSIPGRIIGISKDAYGHTAYRLGFNPRTYIRYDCITNNANIYSLLSMHLCDNKLFGFFIDEIKLIGVFNRLIINDCENSSFLLMLNVRKQLYYKFIFYIIGCDDTYVFNSFRIIISQEIETNTIFFMIDDIR